MASLKDIAEAAGVSIRTVKRVVEGERYVGGETNQRVQLAIQRLGYQPDLRARSLRTGKSYQVVAITWNMDELSMAKLAAFEQRLRQDDFTLTIKFAHPDETDSRRLLQEIIAQKPAGIAVLSGGNQVFDRLIDDIRASALPYIVFDNCRDGVDAVLIDRQQGVYDAVHYLAAQGRQHIAYLGPRERNRLDGYERALTELQRMPLIVEVATVGDGYVSARDAVQRLLALRPRPDAVQVFSDSLACGVLAGLHAAGVRVPTEIAVVGFDNRRAAAWSWPCLTTVAQPNEQVGFAAAEILLRKWRGETPPADGWSQSIPTQLVMLNSVMSHAVSLR
jgi:LacI family transcriptional regulator